MVLFNILTKQLVQKFNVLEEKVQNGGGQWANVSMARFVQWPANFNTNYNYAVLFSDSCLLNLDLNEPNLVHLQDIRKHFLKGQHPKIKQSVHKVSENNF